MTQTTFPTFSDMHKDKEKGKSPIMSASLGFNPATPELVAMFTSFRLPSLSTIYEINVIEVTEKVRESAI